MELIDYETIVACVYRVPKNKNKKMYVKLFFENMEIMLTKLCKKQKKIIVCGDFNINTLNNDNKSKEFRQLLLGYKLKLTIKSVTRLASKTCLDNIAHNIVRGYKSQILDLALSDHTAQILQIPVKNINTAMSWYICRRDYSVENLTKFQCHLENIKFLDMYSTTDPNEAYNAFMHDFILIYKFVFHCEE